MDKLQFLSFMAFIAIVTAGDPIDNLWRPFHQRK